MHRNAVAKTLAHRIRERREALGISKERLATMMQLAGHASLTRKRLLEIEDGERRVTVDELVTFARVLRVPITWLLGVKDFE